MEGEDDIYQIPILEPPQSASAVPSLGPSPFSLGLKKSDTSGNLCDKRGEVVVPSPCNADCVCVCVCVPDGGAPVRGRSPIFNGNTGSRRRPASTYLLESATPKPAPPLALPARNPPPLPYQDKSKPVEHPPIPPTSTAPSPPPRTTSKHAEPVPK